MTDTWFPICSLAEFPMYVQKSYIVQEESILLYRTEECIYAVENFCSHQGFPLVGGCIKNDKIYCPFHGAVFCLKTGAVLGAPAMVGLKTFLTRIKEGCVEIFLRMPKGV